MTIRFAKRLFLAAGIYGIVVIAPMFFLEKRLNELDPPAITHPEWYYGFLIVTLAWQIVYLIMSRDPLRYRPMIIPAVIGKAGFAVSAMVLAAQHRLPVANLFLPSIDLVLTALFLWAFVSLRRLIGHESQI